MKMAKRRWEEAEAIQFLQRQGYAVVKAKDINIASMKATVPAYEAERWGTARAVEEVSDAIMGLLRRSHGVEFTEVRHPHTGDVEVEARIWVVTPGAV